MSIIYTVKERLTIPEVKKEHKKIITNFYKHIENVIENVESEGRNIRFIVETEKICFKTKEMKKVEKQEMLEKVKKCESIDIYTEYDYVRRGDAGPLEFTEYYATKIGPIDSAFYTVYNQADCSDDSGIVCAYGIKDGKTYNGELEYKQVDTIPNGAWYEWQSMFQLETEEYEETVKPTMYKKLCKACDKLAKYGDGTTNIQYDTGISFFLNNLLLHNDDDISTFAKEAAVILKYRGFEDFELLFSNDVTKAFELLKLTLYADGTYKAEIAKV